MIKNNKIICFNGLDGSGKSTMSFLTARVLKQRGKKVFVIKKFSFFLLFWPIKIAGLFTKKDKQAVLNNPVLNYRKKNRLLKLFPILALIDCWINYLITVFPLRIFYDYIIFDRYFYDFSPNFIEYGYGDKDSAIFFMKYLPRVNYCFYLNLPAEKAFMRKKEFNLDYLKKMEQNYNEIFLKFPWIINIRAGNNLDTLTKQVLNKIK